MKIAVDVPHAKDVLKARLFLGEPVFGAITDPETRTSVRIHREDDMEHVKFETQGETLAALIKPPGATSGVLNLHDPSPEVDLFLFWDVIRGFYSEIPELQDYIRAGFKTDPETAFDGLKDESDRVVYAAVMNLGWYFEPERVNGIKN